MIVCPSCSTPANPSSRFCSGCGSSLAPQASANLAETAPAPAGPSFTPLSSPSSAPRFTTSDSIEAARFAPGAMVAARYRILGLLGRGGMGEVYRADDLTLGQPVALKFLPAALATDPARLARFHNEVRIARQVSHPNVCRIYDIGQHEGEHFLSMEFVDGEDLASLLRRIGRLPGDKASEIARQICAGLAAAHDRGVLHRDLKPANIMLDGRGKARITDFGLARAAGELRSDGAVEGTPAYMAPEQFTGSGESLKSDLYALGLVLYELFTGKQAFKAASIMELARLHRESNPTSPTTLIPDLDPAVERVILRCLQKDPEARPASALAVAAALPGGDPLAAALAAGETPSPEMVAAAGENVGVEPRTAAAALAATIVGLAVVVVLSQNATLLGKIPAVKSPEVLAERGREIARRLGYGANVKDDAYGFGVTDYLRYVRENDRSPNRWDRLRVGQPTALVFWYRESPRYLVTTEFARGGHVSLNQPPQLVSEMTSVQLDPEGRLVKFDAVPLQVEDSKTRGAKPDWSALFASAELPLERFTPIEPAWTPPVYSDARAAWEGVYPKQPEVKIRIEAAASGGKPVYFQIFEPWSRPRRMEEPPVTTGIKIANILGLVVLFGLLTGAIVLARINLRAGRGDRKGAFRLALFIFGLLTASGLLDASYAPTLDVILPHTVVNLGTVVLIAAAIWIVYLALEPHVRRIWPRTLISWTRALSGGWADPLIGRDLLVAGAAGVAWAALEAGSPLVAERLGLPPPPPLFAAFGLTSTLRRLLSITLTLGAAAVLEATVALLFLFLVRLVVRKVWLAAAVIIAIRLVIVALVADAVAVYAVTTALIVASAIFVLLRFGLLAMILAVYFSSLLRVAPLTTDLSRWYSGSSMFAIAVVAGLVIYGFRIALARRPLFRTALAE